MTADDPRSWIGRVTEAHDIASPGAVRRLSALLDHATPPWPEGVLPSLAHWLYFLPEERQSMLAGDGHAPRGDFLPPAALAAAALPRRMWAGGRVEFHHPIRIGARMTRRSSIAAVSAKHGTSGELVFVTSRHEVTASDEIVADGALAVIEERDIVFCAPPGAAGARDRAQAERPGTHADHQLAVSDARRSLSLGPVELFRFSALTFNAHRIHYDRDYARTVEGYPGLVVHGPYLAMLLLDHYLRAYPAAPIKRLSYRAQAPLFEGEQFKLCARASAQGASLWAQRGNVIAMRAEVGI